MERRSNVLHVVGVIEIIVAVCCALGAVANPYLMIAFIINLFGGLTTLAFGDCMSNVDAMASQTDEQQKRLDFQSSTLVKIFNQQKAMLEVLKSIDGNQAMVGNYSNQQLSNIANSLSSYQKININNA